MTPALVHLHDFKPGEPSTSAFTREAEAMVVQPTIYSRDNSSSSSSGGVEENTIIFIVVGTETALHTVIHVRTETSENFSRFIRLFTQSLTSYYRSYLADAFRPSTVCLLVILIGFYFVSRPRAASNAAPSVPSSHPQHSPIIHPPRPRPERDRSECWKIWKVWRHTSNTEPPTATNTPTSQVSPAPATITRPSRIIPARGSSKTYPPIAPRPQQARRVTSLSVTTSFSHSHITQEDLNNFRLSAYDLDGDLETEMLNSARDDVWPGRVLAMEEGCGSMGMEEVIEGRGNASPITEGSVEGYVPCATQWGGGDYENPGACPTAGIWQQWR
ncbi:hypothetical protein J3R83DRAFT_13410 [Lanmaoa asiatica]|nr:hypothetical protein J3R83DRAFT_13410 [Lanmaoa asiatica]